MDEIKPGRYRHYKGKFYYVLGLVRNAKTEERDTVLYTPLHGEPEFCIRSLEDFNAIVTVEGKKVPRFTYVDIS